MNIDIFTDRNNQETIRSPLIKMYKKNFISKFIFTIIHFEQLIYFNIIYNELSPNFFNINFYKGLPLQFLEYYSNLFRNS